MINLFPQAQVIDTVYDVQEGTDGLVPALDSFCQQVVIT